VLVRESRLRFDQVVIGNSVGFLAPSGHLVDGSSMRNDMRQSELKAAHKRCGNHRNELKAAATCGCFHCLEVFHPAEIKEWTDRGQTAICPRCGIDSVLPETPDFKVTKEMLQAMEAYWFADY